MRLRVRRCWGALSAVSAKSGDGGFVVEMWSFAQISSGNGIVVLAGRTRM